MEGSFGRSSEPPQFEQKRPLAGLLVPQRAHVRSGGRCGENSNCGAAGRRGASLARAAAAGATGTRPRGGVGATPTPSPEGKRFPQS